MYLNCEKDGRRQLKKKTADRAHWITSENPKPVHSISQTPKIKTWWKNPNESELTLSWSMIFNIPTNAHLIKLNLCLILSVIFSKKINTNHFLLPLSVLILSLKIFFFEVDCSLCVSFYKRLFYYDSFWYFSW